MHPDSHEQMANSSPPFRSCVLFCFRSCFHSLGGSMFALWCLLVVARPWITRILRNITPTDPQARIHARTHTHTHTRHPNDTDTTTQDSHDRDTHTHTPGEDKSSRSQQPWPMHPEGKFASQSVSPDLCICMCVYVRVSVLTWLCFHNMHTPRSIIGTEWNHMKRAIFECVAVVVCLMVA